MWDILLNGAILRVRPRRKARDYRKIWNHEEERVSAQNHHARAGGKACFHAGAAGRPCHRGLGDAIWSPSIAAVIAQLAERGCERLLLIPLYPQYCAATTATACDEVFRALLPLRYQPALRVAAPYYNDPIYIEALASSLNAEIAQLSYRPEVIVASFHGVPQAFIEAGDPYYAHCAETVRLLRKALNLDEAGLIMTFQSRFGRAKWLGPATDQSVKQLAKRGVKNIAVVMPGFAADCLETLEEIAVENAHIFKKYGGGISPPSRASMTAPRACL